jgi:hypothetical protein
LAASSRPSTSRLGASVGALDFGSEPGFGESLGRGLEVCVVVGVGVGVVVGVVVVEGVVLGEGAVMLSDGGAGWLGTGDVTPGTGTTAEGALDGTHLGSANETCGVGVDDGGVAAAGEAASTADCPVSVVAADVEDAVE